MPATKTLCAGFTLFFAVFASCHSRSGKSFVPAIAGYNDKLHEIHILNKDLLEVSGIVHLGGLQFAAINDEDGELFFTNLENDSLVKYRFKGKGDYEDLAKVGDTYYVLESSGNIVELDQSFSGHETYKFGEKHIEFESLVHYPDRKKLVLIVKDQKKRADGISAFSFDLTRKEYDPEPFFSISFKEVFTVLTNYNNECKPSSAAINPVNKKLYILAAVGRVILQCSPDGKLEEIYKINPTHFSQPEGITFATNGDMFISNEGAEGKATILKFPYDASK